LNTGLPHQLVRSAASNYVGRAVSLATWFLLTPFVLHHLGPGQYALWVLVSSVVAYGSLLDFGIAHAVTKFVAEHRAQGEFERARSVFATAVALFLGVGALIVLLSGALAPIFPDLFDIPASDRQMASWLVGLSGAALGLAIPCTAAPAVLRGLQRFDLVNLVNVVGSLLSAAGTVLVLWQGAGAIGLVLVNLVVRLALQVPTFWLIDRVAPDLRFGWRDVRRSTARTVASFSYLLFLTHLGGQLETKTDEIVIGRFLPLVAVTPYNLARQLGNLPQLLTQQFLVLLLPLASEMNAGNERERLRSLHLVSTRLTLAVSLPFACGLTVLAGPFLTAWVGPGYAQYGHIVVLLTVASVIDTSVWPAAHILQGIARHALLAVAAIGTGLANLALSLALVNVWGVLGVALGTLIPTTVVCLGAVVPYALRVLGISTRQMLRHAYLPALLPAVPTLVVLYALREAFQPQGWFALLLVGGLGLLTYAAAYLSGRSSAMERRLARQLAVQTLRLAALRWPR
jgi:O-antigen/teichoic acid export membrane protein